MYLELPIKLMAKKAFTLVELLVIIAIISLLTAVLMPALARAKQQAKGILCLSNLRQMAIAATAYTDTYDGHYPFGYYNLESNPPFMTSRSWDFVVIADWSSFPPRYKTRPGLLWDGEGIEQIQQCPSFKGASNVPGEKYTGYNYNVSYIGSGAAEAVPQSVRITEVRNSAYVALFGDGQLASENQGANKYMRSPLADAAEPDPGQLDFTFSARYAGAQSYRHLGKTNVAFCDGHAQSWRQLYTETDSSGKEKLDEYNKRHKVKIGFLSPDNRAYDLK